MGKFKFWTCFVVLGVLLLSSYAIAAYTDKGIRYWSGPDHTRVVIALEDSDNVDWKLKDGPYRIEIRFNKPIKDWDNQFVFVEDKYVDHIAYIPLKGSYVVIIFLKNNKKPNVEILTLNKENERPFRIVVDVMASAEDIAKLDRDRANEVEKAKKEKKRIVVVDPGHGGSDPGAIGVGGLMEKDVVLDIALKVKALCGKEEDFLVFLTRDGDYFVSLPKRVEIARKYGADLFISIHANSAPNNSYSGFMAFVLAPRGARGGIEKFLQDIENNPTYGDAYSKTVAIEKVLLDFTYEYTMTEGRRVAKFILDKAQSYTSFENRGIKEASFFVLRNPGVPAVLLEVGFLSNKEDVEKLSSEEERVKVAKAICEGVKAYFDYKDVTRNILARGYLKSQTVKPKETKDGVMTISSKGTATQPLDKGKDSLTDNEKAPVSNKNYKVYVVKEGDTLFRISRFFNVSLAELLELNRIKNYFIYPGMKLLIPVR